MVGTMLHSLRGSSCSSSSSLGTARRIKLGRTELRWVRCSAVALELRRGMRHILGCNEAPELRRGMRHILGCNEVVKKNTTNLPGRRAGPC
jgi:hypothetical protein